MYNLQEIAKRIKSKAKTNGTNLKTMLSDCELGINTISQMSKGNDMLSKTSPVSLTTLTVLLITCLAEQTIQT